LTKIAIAIVLIFSIILVYNTSSSDATESPDNTTETLSLDNTSSVDNITAVTLERANATANATIAAAQTEANRTLAAAQAQANITLAEAEANQTLAEAERKANITQAVAQQAFTDLPGSIAGVLAAAIVLIIAVPVLTDLLLAHYRQHKQRAFGRPLGMSGLYRSLMAFGLIAVVSILVVYLVALVSFYIAIESPASTALINVLQNLAAILGTALATVIAFYFGIRGAETATDKALIAAGVKLPGTAGQGVQPGPPKITGRYPAKDQKNVGVSTQIVAIFSEPMNSETITKDTFILRKEGSTVNENVEYVKLENDITAVLQPIGDLDKGKKYTVTITKEVKDQAGNKMASDETWSFTTRNA
jgi:hypothetical protein